MFDHTLHHSVLLNLIHIYNHTRSVTTTKKQTKQKKLVTIKVQTKLKHNYYSFLAFRRQVKDTFFISSKLQL